MSAAAAACVPANDAGARRIKPVRWYRSPLDPAVLKDVQARSDLLGGLQSLGYLGLLTVTGALAFYSCERWPCWATVLLTFLHGTFFAFQINAVHELCHGTVFKTPALNELFTRVFAFLGWINFHTFAKAHAKHHQFTLHPPHDLELSLPIRITRTQFFQKAFFNPTYGDGIWAIGEAVRHARGRFVGDRELMPFPADDHARRRAPVLWARALLAGHSMIVVGSVIAAVTIAPRMLMLPVLTTFAGWYGGWLFFLCNNTQHIGLRDNVADYRLCCRTIELNRFLRFLYWHMNFHIEHHMYTQVPCYRLARLHHLISDDLPPSQRGLLATWREIAAIQARQDEDPSYQYDAVCPIPARPSRSPKIPPPAEPIAVSAEQSRDRSAC